MVNSDGSGLMCLIEEDGVIADGSGAPLLYEAKSMGEELVNWID